MYGAVSRRQFLQWSGALAVGGRLAAQAGSTETRIDAVLRAYDAQGNHRTGTAADAASARWLADEARRAGGAVQLPSFTLERLDVTDAFLEAGGQRIEGLPFFDGGLTARSGVSAPVRPDGIVVVTATPAAVATEGEFLADIRRSGRAQAIVALTAGGVPGLIPSNARHFATPYGCAVLQVPAHAQPVLDAAEASGTPVRVVCAGRRVRATALNVLVECPGRDASLPPVVVITPRSGWWRCASERGGGIACWLEVVRALAANPGARRVILLASSGHELGHLGLDSFLHAEPGRVKTAHAWLHLGANIGAGSPGGRVAGVLIQASDDAIERSLADALSAAGAPIADRLPRGHEPRGEARNLHVGGARYVSLLGQGNRWFHHQDDRYPETVSAEVVARYARAAVAGVQMLAS